MRKKFILFFGFALVLVAFLAIFVAAAPKWKTDPCPIKQDTNVVFYGETGFGGVGTPSRSWMIHFLDWWEQQDPSVNYVELDSRDVKSDCVLSNYPNLKLYIQPGGNAYYQQNKLGVEGKTNIKNFLNNDKAYFGSCAGFYYAAGDYYWQGDYYNWPNLLGLYPTIEGSITDIADYDGNPGYALTTMSNGYEMIYYGGPTSGWRDTSNIYPGSALLTLSDIPNNLPGAIKNGKMLLTTVHPEAYENDGITGLTTSQRVENYKWLANSLNDVAGTNFYVPPYVNPPQCGDGIDNDNDSSIDYPNDIGCDSVNDDDETDSLPPPVVQCNDGVDNDGDSLIDLADAGCDDSSDDDETDVVGPLEIFYDGFESGNLNNWMVYGTGNPWTASSNSPYQGTYSAMSLQSGAGEPTYMESVINSSGFSSITLEYQRKLVGLDAADDFEVAYFDGAWNALEHLSGVTDAGYVYRSFNIPSSTISVRFTCETGAVSELCFIDNIRITGA
jgi:hypothetical protein